MGKYKVTYRLWNEYETIVEDCDSPVAAMSDVKDNYFEINELPTNGGGEIVDVKEAGVESCA